MLECPSRDVSARERKTDVLLDLTHGAAIKNQLFVVTVVQLVERQIVILVVAGSSPVGHPTFFTKKAQSNPLGFFIFTNCTFSLITRF